jgi:DeoR family transcriptional regulator, suf operon transcriptional repressor
VIYGIGMQETRLKILHILKQRELATVDEIVEDLTLQRGKITPVTVRHHLAKLQDEGFIQLQESRHRTSPGRPQHIYTLTAQGEAIFPNNYKHLAKNLLEQVTSNLMPAQVNVIIEGLSSSMAYEANIPLGTITDRLDSVVTYLNQHGYVAHWESVPNGYLLHTSNCPYHNIVDANHSLCLMDMQLVGKMLGVLPRLASHMVKGDETCSYFIPSST